MPSPAQGEAEGPTLSSTWLRWGGLGETFEGSEGCWRPKGSAKLAAVFYKIALNRG